MQILRQLSALVDGLNDLIGRFIRWLALFMVLIGAISAVVRYFARSQQWTLNLTPATESQWYLFSMIFLMGAVAVTTVDVVMRKVDGEGIFGAHRRSPVGMHRREGRR